MFWLDQNMQRLEFQGTQLPHISSIQQIQATLHKCQVDFALVQPRKRFF
jgi:hypothetical protein